MTALSVVKPLGWLTAKWDYISDVVYGSHNALCQQFLMYKDIITHHNNWKAAEMTSSPPPPPKKTKQNYDLE